jgi:hypothetical protein
VYKMARIFVSSTSKDLEECREKVRTTLRRIGHEDIAMEYFVAEDTKPLKKCLKDVASCDLYVGIFAWRYGYIPDGYDKSMTELEYRKAVEAGIECLIFLLHEDASWPKKDIDMGKDAEKIAALRNELSTEYIVSFFHSADELASLVGAAVHQWENERRVETPKANTEPSSHYNLSLREPMSLNPSAKIQINQEDDLLLLLDESPFHPFGTIPLDHQSYIKRHSDLMLNGLLKKKLFICLHGDFCSGKSSLLIRVPCMLSKGWNVCQPKLDLYQIGRKNTFEKNFFDDLQNVDTRIQNWISLNEFLMESKLVFLIDEINTLPPQEASKLIEKLYAIIEKAPSSNVRLVLTCPKSLNVYIKEIGLKNTKYCYCWETVKITNFSQDELLKLLGLFPPRLTSSLQEKLNEIQKCTLMKPSEVQKFCDDLWKYLSGNEIPIREIDKGVEYYLRNSESYDNR